MLGREDYLNICHLMEKKTTLFGGIEEAAAGFMIYNKLKACIHQIDNPPAPEQPTPTESTEKLAVVPTPEEEEGEEVPEGESNDGEN